MIVSVEHLISFTQHHGLRGARLHAALGQHPCLRPPGPRGYGTSQGYCSSGGWLKCGSETAAEKP